MELTRVPSVPDLLSYLNLSDDYFLILYEFIVYKAIADLVFLLTFTLLNVRCYVIACNVVCANWYK